MISRTRSSATRGTFFFEQKQKVHIRKDALFRTAVPPQSDHRIRILGDVHFGPHDTFFVALTKIVIDQLGVIIEKPGCLAGQKVVDKCRPPFL